MYYNHFEITGGSCNLIGSNRCDLYTNRIIFCFKSHLFPSQWGGYTKKKQPIRFQGVFKVANQIGEKWKTKSIMWQILQLLYPKLLFLPPKKWMNLISNRLNTASIKYLNWLSPIFRRFQNGCNKVVVESNLHCALVRFRNHAYDFSPNCTSLEQQMHVLIIFFITFIYMLLLQSLSW